MKNIVRTLGTLVIVTLMASGAHALEADAKCDKAKSKASAKQFSTCMKCLTKNYADSEFDYAACRQAAEDKCVTAFADADTKGAGACRVEGNGPARCDETDVACGSIYAGI